MLFITIISIIAISITQGREPIVRLVSTGHPPNLEMADSINYHLLLSHAETTTGQDKINAIARNIRLVLPNLKFLLDIDEEESIKLKVKFKKTKFSSIKKLISTCGRNRTPRQEVNGICFVL